MARLNWLHISDVHIRGEDFDRNTVWAGLLRDVRNRVQIDSSLDRIDLVFLTGDLVFGGSEEEYEFAYRDLIEPLTQELKIKNLSEKVFLVPGNHDIDRRKIRRSWNALRQMLNQENKREEIRDLLLDEDERELLLEPQTSYFEFFSDTFDKIELLSPCNHYVHRVSIQDIGSVAVVGLNSAWLAYGGDEDRGRLFLGEPQVAKALDRCADTDFVICLLHHPFEWFNPNNPDTDQCKSRLIEKSHIILHGHLHAPDLVSASTLAGDTIIIPAGAVFTTRNAPLSYNYVSLDLESGEGKIFFRRYSDRQRDWVKDLDSTGDAADGKCSFITQPLQPISETLPVKDRQPQLVLDDEEEGFLDWAVRMMDAGDALTELMQKFERSADNANNKINISVEQLHNTRGDLRRAKAVVMRIATIMNVFAQDIDEVTAEMKTQWQSFYRSFLPFLSLESGELTRWLTISEDTDSYVETVIELAATVETVSGQVAGLWDSINEARSMVVQLRGMDRSLNRAVRKVDQAFGYFQDVLDEINDNMSDLAQLSRTLPEVLALLGLESGQTELDGAA